MSETCLDIQSSDKCTRGKGLEDGLRVNKKALIFYFHQSMAEMLNRSLVISKRILYPKGKADDNFFLGRHPNRFSFIKKLGKRNSDAFGWDK